MIWIYTIKEGLSLKVGISNKPKQRLKAIRRDYRRAKWGLVLPTPFVAGWIEKLFHSILKPFRDRRRKGSGKTEWFRIWPLRWVVNILITAIVAGTWYGLYRVLIWIAETY